MAHTTKLYRNTTKEDINVLGIGVIPAGEQVSVSSEYQAPINVANYPGLIDVSATEEQERLDAEHAEQEATSKKAEGSKK